MAKKEIVVLFSGGLDSTLMLALALKKGLSCHALSFNYGQRHSIELTAAKKILDHYASFAVSHTVIDLNLDFLISASSLMGKSEIKVDQTISDERKKNQIPTTYVPARNTLFLAFAVAFAEKMHAEEIHLGCNKDDVLHYPDCRPLYIQTFQNVLNCATKQAVEKGGPKLVTPLADWNKKEIACQAKKNQVPIELTWSCYNPQDGPTACHQCNACLLRAEALLGSDD